MPSLAAAMGSPETPVADVHLLARRTGHLGLGFIVTEVRDVEVLVARYRLLPIDRPLVALLLCERRGIVAEVGIRQLGVQTLLVDQAHVLLIVVVVVRY